MLMKDLCKDYFWIMPKTPKYTEAASIPYITSKNLKEGYINYSNCKYITKETFKKLTSKRYIQEDDFLISMIGTIGEVGIVKKSDLPIYGQNMYLLRPDFTKVNKRYLYHFLSSSYLKNKLLSIINGATQGYLHDKDIIDQPIKLYDLRVQNFIADELDLINNAIKLKQNELLSLDKIIKSRFIEMFGDPKSNPKGYPIKKIEELFDVGSSKRVFESEWTTSGVPFYRAREIVKLSKDGFVDNELFITREMFEKYKSKYGVPKPNDMMVTGVGTLGICYIVKDSDEFYFKDGNTLWFKNKNLCNVRFIYDQYNTDFVREQIDSNANVSTVGTYTITNAKNTLVLVPPIELQNEYVSFVKQVDKSKFIVQEQIKNLQELFDKKMDEYFGE